MLWLLAFLLLYTIWILLSGFFTPFLLAAGAGCAIFVLWMTWRMKQSSGHTEAPMPVRLPALITYLPWLMWEIVKSALDVSRRILSPKLDISPTLIHFTPSQQTDLGLAIHANSLTLTPGTITIEVEPGHMYVHALSKEGAAGLEGSEMDRRIRDLEGESA